MPSPKQLADKVATKPPRRQNRFNEREAARAGRAGIAIGADRVDIDPATGKISIILPGKGGTPPANEWDAATEKLKTKGL
jgi:hypothetical protein